ncbi:MAG: phenylpyruvate tautomerase MIF-related protein [Cyanobacteria bacterium P01_H01_bin.15]
MPLIRVLTSASTPEPAAADVLLKKLSKELASQLGKSESYVMAALEPQAQITFGGDSTPACLIEIKSIGQMTPAQTTAMSQAFCKHIETGLDVPQDRTYIEFVDVRRPMWGWNGQTF